ncbi:exonuclease subunit SbcD [Rapidithrix thailandica]|uniref:Nuclease SbcCD subunit D n=1 Tax=Rapidithrix thailandica TaxID=413964 RepID=A0AAW9SCE2_9BACT
MKILHTADWHLGKKLNEFSRLDEQKEVLHEICNLADQHQVDVVLIAGDLFDTFNPPADAVELFYQTLHRLSNRGQRAVVAIAGNHDSADRIEAPDPLARACGIVFSGYPATEVPAFSLESGLKSVHSAPGFIELSLPQYEYPLRLLLTPYANEARLRQFLGVNDPEAAFRQVLEESWQSTAQKYCDEQGVNILLSHLFMVNGTEEQPVEEPEDEKHILHVGGAQAVYTENIPSQIQYTALGHLHRFHFANKKNASPVVYSGSLLEYSFSEAHQQKFVMLLDAVPGEEVQVTPLKITSGKKLYRKRFESPGEALEWLEQNQDCFVELTLVSDDYLSAQLKKELFNVHSGIVTLIPEVKRDRLEREGVEHIDPSRDVELLFKQYFQHKKGQEVNEELLELFRQVTHRES